MSEAGALFYSSLPDARRIESGSTSCCGLGLLLCGGCRLSLKDATRIRLVTATIGGMIRWLMRQVGRFWDWMDDGVRALRRRLDASPFGDEAAELEAEVQQLSSRALALVTLIWDRFDELPFVPSLLRIDPIRRRFYAHGAFMGAAPALLAEMRWRRILAFLMPDVYADVSEALEDGLGSDAIIPMFENNPVMCAFGLWRSLATASREGGRVFDLVGVEWDLFIDGDLAEAYALSSDRDEQRALAARILESAVIAHASAADTVQEALGVCQHVDVRKTRKTRLGGLEVTAWIDLLVRALMLRCAEDPRALMLEMAALPRVEDDEQCLMHTFVEPIPAEVAIERFVEITGWPYLSIVLEIKSKRSSPELVTDIVDALNLRGIHVAAAGSFLLEQIVGLSEHTQLVRGQRLAGPREVLFFHFAGDLQQACDDEALPDGVSALFNGASLLEADEDGERVSYRIKEDVIAELSVYKARHDLHIGLYVQEGDCDSEAAQLLSSLVGRSDDPFDLGFAWGGLRGQVSVEPSTEPRMGYGNQWGLELVGQARHWKVCTEARR